MAHIQNYQQRPALRTLFNHYPHPSRGQGFWYSHEVRQATIHAVNIGHRNDTILRILKTQKLWPCKRTIRRWLKKRHNESNLLNYRRTGNKRATILRRIKTFKLVWLMAVFLESKEGRQ